MDAKRRHRWKVGKARKRSILRFCRNYPIWKWKLKSGKYPPDSPEHSALLAKIALVEESARESEPCISEYLIKAVTEGLPYNVLALWEIPCGPDYYYDRRNKMIFLLDKMLKRCEVEDEEIVSLVLPDTSGGSPMP